jgi:hypothetical protein
MPICQRRGREVRYAEDETAVADVFAEYGGCITVGMAASVLGVCRSRIVALVEAGRFREAMIYGQRHLSFADVIEYGRTRQQWRLAHSARLPRETTIGKS